MTPQLQNSSDERELTSRYARAGVAPGDVIDGKYRVEAPIAEGGMGIVVRARHLGLDCSVALKVIRPEHLANEEVIQRLLSEARIIASLRSKHVNRVLDVGRTAGGAPYLVLEYLTGCDLSAYLERRGALPVGEAVSYVMQACAGLAEAHAIGIVHRDLKPENLFLSQDADGGFTLKVLDFGISKAPARYAQRSVVTNPFEVIGSPTYMSPEQAQGVAVDARADIWALGALLHELCTGRVLFETSSMAATFTKILDEHYLPEPYGPGHGAALLHQVVCRCLRRNPDERYRDVVELAQQLAPLGTDALQAARVARVAATSLARVAAGSTASELPATPLSIARSDAVLAGVGSGARPLGRWLLIGVAAAISLLAAVGYSRRMRGPELVERASREPRVVVVAPVRALPLAANAALSPVEMLAVPTLAAPLPLKAPVSPVKINAAPLKAPASRVKGAASPAKAAAWSVRTAALPANTAVAPVPAEVLPRAASSFTAPPQPPQQPVASDAWDPKTFGGRR